MWRAGGWDAIGPLGCAGKIVEFVFEGLDLDQRFGVKLAGESDFWVRC